MFKLNDSWTAKGTEDLTLHLSLFGNQESDLAPGPRKKRKKRKDTEETINGSLQLDGHRNTPLNDTVEQEAHIQDTSDLVTGKHCKDKNRKRKGKSGDVSETPQSQAAATRSTHYEEDKVSVSSNSRGSTQTDIQKKKKSKLHSKMASKMEGAHFRWINEQLYTMSGNKALELFQESPDLFQAYHKGFTTQVSKWPCNPLDRIISYVRSLPLNFVIADFGCGEAELAKSVPHQVHSFDLVPVNDRVTACDMAHVPLFRSSVDVCVFCLSLMGTNITDFIKEARRVMKKNGRMKICEIESRFKSVDDFIRDVETIGFRLVNSEAFSKMFVDFEFERISKELSTGRESLPQIQLKPCVYKKR